MLYGVWMARKKHRLALWLYAISDWLIDSSAKQVVKAVSNRLGKKS